MVGSQGLVKVFRLDFGANIVVENRKLKTNINIGFT